MKRLLALVLSICLMLSCLPLNAIALGTEQPEEAQTEPQVAPQSEEETQAPAEVPEQPVETTPAAEENTPVVNEGGHADHGSCICAVSGAVCSHEQLTWTAWESTTSLPTEAGNYYLTGNVVVGDTVKIAGKVNLCMNGFSIDLNEKYIDSAKNDELIILNCKAALKANGQLDETNSQGGKITNGKYTHGAAVVVGAGGKLTAIGVEFYKNVNYRSGTTYNGQGGGAIYNEGDAQLYACRFVENTSNNYGGAIAQYYAGSLIVDDCYFSGNSAKIGGAVTVYTGGSSTSSVSATISGNTEITGNSATGHGGAIVVYRYSGTPAGYTAKVVLKDNVKITGNQSGNTGGAIYAYGGGEEIQVSGNVKITGNTATKAPNVYLWNKDNQKLTVGTLGANASIGIFTGDNFTTAAEEPDDFLILASGATLSEKTTTGIYFERDGIKQIAYSATDGFYYPDHAHQSCICAITGNNCGDHSVAPIWTAWESTTSLPTEPGYYYLTDNVKVSDTVKLNGQVNLCMNGFSIDLNEKYIDSAKNDELIILNCKAALKANGQLDETNSQGGKITNGKYTHGAAVVVGAGGKLTAIGVEFYKNVNYRSGTTYNGQGGGAIYNEGDAQLYACRFVENTSNNYGGAIAQYCNGSLIVDDCYFSGNTAKVGGAVTVYTGSSSTSSVSATISGNTEITGNSATSHGGAIVVYRYSGTPADYTAKVVLKDNVKITGNSSGDTGGAIYATGGGEEIQVSGNVQITGNTATKAPNLYLWNKDNQKLTVGSLGVSASIGIFTGDQFAAADPDEFLVLASGVTMSDTESTGLFFEKTNPVKYIGYSAAEQFYFVTEPPKPHEHGSCICAVSGATCSHTELTWTAWQGTTSLPTEAGNYYLTEKVTLDATVVLEADIKICLNGYDIDLNDYKIVNKGDLTVMNCQAELNAKNQLTSTAGKLYNAASPNDDSKSGIYYQGGAIGTSGPLTLIAVHLNDNYCYQTSDARSGGAIYAERTTVTVESCSFTGNESKGSGGVIATYAGTLNIKDSLFKDNKAAKRGGAICVNSNTATAVTNVEITGNCEFTGNEVTSTATTTFYGCGGAIFIYKNGTTYEVNVTIGGNTVVSGNSASQEGGGICLRNSDGTKPMQFTLLDNVQIHGNGGADSFDNIYFENSSQKVKIGNLSETAQVYISTKTEVTDPDDFLAAADGVTPAVTEDTHVVYDNNGKVVAYNETDKFYFVAPPAPAHKHGDCICAITGATCSHAQLTWTAWENTTSLPTAAGNYYLTDNVTLAAITDISADVKLCLNGFNINLNGKKIHNTGSLTVINCQAEVNSKNQLTSVNGKIYGGDGSSYSNQSYGGAISTFGQLKLIGVLVSNNVAKGSDARTGGALYVDDNGSVIAQSCKFEGNQALSSSSTNANLGVGGAISVYKGGSLTITDTVFENNIADLYGGAICVNNRYSTKAATVTIDGNCSFTGNKANSSTDGYGSALYLYARSEETAGKLTVNLGGNTEITGNTAGKYGAVLLRTNAAAANDLDVTISGNVKIYGNSASSDVRANLYFNDDGKSLKVGQLGSGATVYVSTKTEIADPDAVMALASGVTLQDMEITGFYYDRVDPAKTVGYSNDASVKFYFVDTTVYEHDDHGVCRCVITEETCSHSSLTWKPWTSATALPTDAGNYFLTKNVKLEAVAVISDEVNICLNGYDIDLNGKKIVSSGSLAVMNCQAEVNEKYQLTSTTGKIHGGNGASYTALIYGGAIGSTGDLKLIGVLFADNIAKGADARTGGALYVENCVATIESCKFTGNQAQTDSTADPHRRGVGGAISVYKGGSLDIVDTVFENNTADLWGGAICVNNRYSTVAATVNISGNSEFTGNTAKSIYDGYGAALYLYARSEDGGTLAVNISDNTKITDNTSTKDGAVYLRTHANATEPLAVTVSDNVQIHGNTGANKMYADVYFYDLSQKLQVGQIGENLKVNIGSKDAVADPDEVMEVASGVTLQDMEVTGFYYTNIDPAANIGYSTDPSIKFYFALESAAEHTDHAVCDCFLSGESCTDETVKWVPWIYDDQLPTTAGNYFLTCDVKVTNTVSVKAAGVNLCLNGFNIDLSEKYISIGSAGGMTIINCKAAAKENGQLDETKSVGGKITNGKHTHGAAVSVTKGGKFTAIGVEFTKNTNYRETPPIGQGGGAIYVEGIAELYACRFADNTSNNYGGAVTVYVSGSVKINDCYFTGNTAVNGGALSVYTGGSSTANVVATLTGDNDFVGNTVTGQGGAIMVRRHANTPAGVNPKLVVKDNLKITENVAEKDGGGMAILGSTTDFRVDLTGVEISKNKANRGGGIYMEKAKLVGTTITVSDNVAEGSGSNGGGITGMSAIISLQTGTVVSGNKTEKGGGGGIHVSNTSTVNLFGCTISGNEAPDGGGVRLWRNSVLNLKGGKILENTAEQGGGVSFVKGSILNMESGEISKNTSTVNGGGISANNYFQITDTETYELPQLNLMGGKISENVTTGDYGGGIYARNCDTVLSGTVITKNTGAKANGGGMYVSKGSSTVEVEENGEMVKKVFEFEPSFTITGGEISGNKAKNGGGIYSNYVDTTFSDGVVKNNTASENAGGISLRGATLTIKDNALISGNTGKSGGGVIIQGEGTVNMTGGTVEKNSARNAGGFLLWSRSTVNLKGGKVRYNKATKGSGGGIYVQSGAHLKMTGGSVSYNDVTSNGGGIYATKNDDYYTRVTISGGSITGNYAKNSGGGMYTNKGAIANIYGGYWASNEVKVCGGAIYANASPLNLYGGTFTKNHAEDCGGAINTKACKVLLDGATITENISDARGGGLRIYNDCEFVMKSGEITNNEAARGGGGMAFYNCKSVDIEGGKITGNKVTGSELYPNPIGGGAINVYEGASTYKQQYFTVNISGGEISDNYSLTNGGAIVTGGKCTVNITGGKIVNNTAEQMGGAILVDNLFHMMARPAVLNYTGGEISGNTATDGAAIYARNYACINMDGVTIEGNTASGTGGALYLARGATADLKNTLFTNNKATKAAGFYAVDDFQMHNLEVSGNDCGSGHAVYIDKGEFDGRSYVLGIIKMSGDMRITGNHGDKGGLFISENAKINVAAEGLGKNTHIDVELETGVLTNTVMGAYNYEGGNLLYTITYGDRSLTDLEPIPTEATEPAVEETEPATEPEAESQQPEGNSVILPIAVGVAALAIVIIVLILLLKRKKNGGKDA